MFENFYGKVICLDKTVGRKAKPTAAAEIGDKRYVKVPFESSVNNELLNVTAFPREKLFAKVFFKRKERYPLFLSRSIVVDSEKYYKKDQMYQGARRKAEALSYIFLKEGFFDPSVFSKIAYLGSTDAPRLLNFYRYRGEQMIAYYEKNNWFFKFVTKYINFETKKQEFIELKKQHRKIRKPFKKRFPKQPRINGRKMTYSYLRKLWRNRDNPRFEDINFLRAPFVGKSIFF